MAPYLIAPNVKDVEVKLLIPKPVVDFLKAARTFSGKETETFLTRAVIDVVLAEIDNIEAPLWNPEHIKKKYGLSQIHHVNHLEEP